MDNIHMSSRTFRMACNTIRFKKCTRIISKKNANFFNENQEFVLVYIDDMLIFSKTYKGHISHLNMFFRKLEQNDLILSKKKMEICKEKINFLGHEIGECKIYLQDHIAKKDFTIF
jgi:hypothetical protein